MTATDTDVEIDIDLTLEIPCDKDICSNKADWVCVMPCGNRIHACTPCRTHSDEKYPVVLELGVYWYCTPHPDEIVPYPIPWKPL